MIALASSRILELGATVVEGLPTIQELSHRVRTTREAAHALLVAQSAGHSGASAGPRICHSRLRLLLYKIVENNVAGN